MKKLLLSALFVCSLFLVACDSTSGSVTVDIENVNMTSEVFEADLKLKVDYETTDELMELLTSAINLAYDHYKTDFGTNVYTLYFTVYAKDSSDDLGVITYKVNSSPSNPGLTYIGNNLS